MADWLPIRPDRRARLRLFCLPHAGAGASAYRDWVGPLHEHGIAVCPVQLPGRENRFGETPHRSVGSLVDALAAAGLADELDRPYAVFGHSMGAVLAYEWVRSLHRLGGPLPAHLVVSGRIAPQLSDPRGRLHDLPDAELVARVTALGGVPAALLAEPELFAFQLPSLRADLAVNETYRHVPGPQLPVPLTALGGTADPKVDEAELREWAACTSARFRSVLLPGGHFFVQESRAAVLRLLGEVLSARSRTVPAAIRSEPA
jgi:surfactin synthase thioesterase subunit